MALSKIVEKQIFIECVPVAKGRPRAARRGNGVVMYTPAKTEAFETLIHDECKKVFSSTNSPVWLDVTFFLPVPSSWSKKKAADALNGMIWQTSRPDIDNYLKAVLDGGNGAIYADDSQVVSVTMAKKYSEKPGVLIKAKWFE